MIQEDEGVLRRVPLLLTPGPVVLSDRVGGDLRLGLRAGGLR